MIDLSIIAKGQLNNTNHNNVYKNRRNRSKIRTFGSCKTLCLTESFVLYFNQLETFNLNADYEGILTLLEKFKSEYPTNSDLESLVGVFSIIESYESDLSGLSSKGCEIDGGAVGGGAISGAIRGFKLCSWLGPVGSAAGTAGGAIVGAIVSSIVSIGVQGVACETNN